MLVLVGSLDFVFVVVLICFFYSEILNWLKIFVCCGVVYELIYLEVDDCNYVFVVFFEFVIVYIL